jgi:uncharacterized phage infection (PIP) family protein YhgE
LDDDKDKYEPHFRKLYKSMSSRFQINPGMQIAIMYATQFCVFILPRLLKSVANKKPEEGTTDPKQKTYPWATGGARVVELDATGQEMIPKQPQQQDNRVNDQIDALKTELNMGREQLAKQQETIVKLTQMINAYHSGNSNAGSSKKPADEKLVSPKKNKKSSSVTASPEPTPKSEEEVEDEEENDDEDDEAEENEEEENEDEEEENEDDDDEEEENDEGDEVETPPKPLPNGLNPYDIDMPAPKNNFGQMFKPMLDRIRKAKTSNSKKSLDPSQRMYDEAPEMPESMKPKEQYQTEKEDAKPTTKSTSKREKTLVLE